jgi:hypothetical protein
VQLFRESRVAGQIARDVIEAPGDRHPAAEAHAEHVEHVGQAAVDLN